MSILDLGKRLLESAKHGDAQEVQLLVTNGAPFTTDWLGASPLHMAAQYGHLNTAEVLLRAGISRDARTKVDRTPLHVAAQEGFVEIVELLLKHGADIEVKDMLFMTPLHWAVERGHIPVINCMLNHNANVRACSKFQKTPLDIAEDNCRMDIFQILQDHLDNPSKKLKVEKGKEVASLKLPTLQPKPSAVVLPVNVIQQEPLSKFKIKDIITNNLKNRAPNIITTTGVPFVASSSTKPCPVLLRTSLGGIKASLPNVNNLNSNSTDENESSEQKCTNVLATLAALAEATAPNSTVSTQEALKWLEVHGITMLPSDNSTIVATALEGGQTVALTEAGKMALTWIKEQKNVGESASTNNVTVANATPNVITLVTNKSQSQSSPIIIVNDQDSKISSVKDNEHFKTSSVDDKEKLLLLELEKMKKQANFYKSQLLVKEHEAELYRKQLQQLKEATPQKN